MLLFFLAIIHLNNHFLIKLFTGFGLRGNTKPASLSAEVYSSLSFFSNKDYLGKGCLSLGWVSFHAFCAMTGHKEHNLFRIK